MYKWRPELKIVFEWDCISHSSNEFRILKILIWIYNDKDMHVLICYKNLRRACIMFWAILWILYNLSLTLKNLFEWDCRSHFSNEFQMLKNLIWIWDEGDIALGSWVRKSGNALKCKAEIVQIRSSPLLCDLITFDTIWFLKHLQLQSWRG